MEVSGQLQVPADLPQGKSTLYPLDNLISRKNVKHISQNQITSSEDPVLATKK
jgi:hypothetical protein